MRLQNILIANSTFPLLTARPGDNGSMIQAKIRQRLDDSHRLQAQMRIFKGAWEANRAQYPALSCYSEGPTQWVDEGFSANDTNIGQATSRMNDIRQLLVQNNQVDIESANVQRSRDSGGTVPPALLYYNDIVAMKPGSRGRHKMSKKEWGKFEEEAQQWFIATRIAAIPQTNQTRLMEAILDNTLYSRSMMKLREREPLRNFFGAMAILKEAGAQRDPQLYPPVVQAWDFLKKFMSESDRLNWGTEAACRASMRDVHAAAEDCGIGTAINSAEAWAALVVL